MASYYIGSNLNRTYYISHHGILGQKWGVRRYQNEDGSLTAAGRIHGRQKKVGTGSVKVEKGRRIDAPAPVGGVKIDRPKWIDPNVGATSGNWHNAAKYVKNSKHYSKLADWWGKDEFDNLKLANQLQQVAEDNAYAASYNDQSLDIAYAELQDAIDALEENPTDANRRRYESLLNTYMTGVESHRERQKMVLDAQAYVRKCEQDALKTPMFKCYALAQVGKRAVKAKISRFTKHAVSAVKSLLK